LLCLSIRLFPSFSGPWTRHPAVSFLVFLFVLYPVFITLIKKMAGGQLFGPSCSKWQQLLLRVVSFHTVSAEGPLRLCCGSVCVSH
jgi:hypothetical protein